MVAAQKIKKISDSQKFTNERERDNKERDRENKTVHMNMVLDLQLSERIAKFCDRLASRIATVSNLGESVCVCVCVCVCECESVCV